MTEVVLLTGRQGRKASRQTDRQSDREKDKMQTDGRTDRQTARQRGTWQSPRSRKPCLMRCCKPFTTKKSSDSTCDGSASNPLSWSSVTSCSADSFLPGETLIAYFGADLQDMAMLHQPFHCCPCSADCFEASDPAASNMSVPCSCSRLAHHMTWIHNQNQDMQGLLRSLRHATVSHFDINMPRLYIAADRAVGLVQHSMHRQCGYCQKLTKWLTMSSHHS